MTSHYITESHTFIIDASWVIWHARIDLAQLICKLLPVLGQACVSVSDGYSLGKTDVFKLNHVSVFWNEPENEHNISFNRKIFKLRYEGAILCECSPSTIH